MSAKINLELKEIYAQLCPKCKAKLKQLIKEKITDQLVDQTISSA